MIIHTSDSHHIPSQTRHSENDNTPQPLDQWTNSPFIGQQVGNCKVSHWPITWPIYLPCTVALGQSHCASNIISNSHPLSFQVSQPSHSWVTAISKFDLENPRSRSWKRWTLKVTTWVQHSIDSHPFDSMSIGLPIPEIWLFQNLTMKIQGQGHGWGQSWKSQSGCKILSTHIPFVPCQSAIPFLRYDFFQNLTLKIQGQDHGWGERWKSQSASNILSTHIPFFHINWPFHSRDTAFSKFDLENPRSSTNEHDGAQLQA